jgi:hypothetical protein
MHSLRLACAVFLLAAVTHAHARVREPLTEQIRARLGGVRACYDRLSRHEPGLRGKLQLGLDIARSGRVAATQVEVDGLRADIDPESTASLTECIREEALRWRLAPTGRIGGTHVSYVFVFERGH